MGYSEVYLGLHTNVANEPRPVHHRIPNFSGAALAQLRDGPGGNLYMALLFRL